MVSEAIKFPRGKKTNTKEYTTLYTIGDYSMKVGKPGKEFDNVNIKYKDGHKASNANDMTPTIFKKNERIERAGSFQAIFHKFVEFSSDKEALKMLGCIFVRNSMALDHTQDKKGNWRYQPSVEIVNKIERRLAKKLDEPLMVFLHYLELIALNEDTKYYTLGYDITGPTGRKNNMLTYANIIHIFLERDSLSEVDFLLKFMTFSGGLVRPPVGLNPLSFKASIAAFPYLIA